MSKTAHRLYIVILSLIVIFSFIFLLFHGISYYNTSLEERFFHPYNNSLKPSGIVGHGLGIIGTLLILVGVTMYMVRKRSRKLSRVGLLKYWLEFHIFLCTLGPILILFHTAFKFGGLVAVSFWSMVAVFLSGVIGRFIYIQIPRSIEGRELSLSEVRGMKSDIGAVIKESYQLDEQAYQVIIESTKKKEGIYRSNFISRTFYNYRSDRQKVRNVKSVLKKNRLSRIEYRQILKLVKHEITLNRKIDRLVLMQNLFKYWHVAHLPFALVMLIIMVIHVSVTVVFGYRWIF